MLIYGYIGPWDEFDYPRFQNAFRDIIKENEEMTMRIHCGGGSVFEGLAIYDLIRSSTCKVNVIVEGMAASMGGVLALAGDTISMTESAYFMMHPVSGGTYGDKKAHEGQLEVIKNLESRVIAIFKERTSAPEETITDWFNNGKDNWLSAEECLAIALCDKIIKPTKTRKLKDAQASITNRTELEAWQLLNNSLRLPINTKQQTMKKQIVSMLMLSGLFNSLNQESDDAAVEGAMKNLIDKAKKADDLQAKLDALNESTANELINSALQAGKITASEKEDWLKDAKENPTLVAKALGRMSGKPDPNANLKRKPKPGDPDQPEIMNGREDWDFDKWQKEDPKGLAKLEDEAPESFNELFNKKHGK